MTDLRITDYDSLQAAIAAFAFRAGDADFAAAIPLFIQMTEDALNMTLRHRRQESRATARTVAGDPYVDLPRRFLQIRNVRISTAPATRLQFLRPQQMDDRNDDCRGIPAYYRVIGNEIKLNPAPDGIYTLNLDYYKEIEALRDSNTRNWVLDKASRLYLYGALSHRAGYLINDERMGQWLSIFRTLLQQLDARGKKETWNGGPLMPRSDSYTP